MQLFVAVVAAVALAHLAVADFPIEFADATVGGHGRCHNVAPVLTNFTAGEFATANGTVWYLDSSSAVTYSRDECHALKFFWHAHKFVKHNKTYEGSFIYYRRRTIDNDGGAGDSNYCAKYCSFMRQGYMHGWARRCSYAYCNFGTASNAGEETSDLTDEPEAVGHGPCYAHFNVHWDFWVLMTDYKTFTLLSLCSSRQQPNVLLLSRSKQPLSMSTRQRVATFLASHGYNRRLLPNDNHEC